MPSEVIQTGKAQYHLYVESKKKSQTHRNKKSIMVVFQRIGDGRNRVQTFFNVYVFVFEKERIPSRFLTVSSEPDSGLKLMNHEVMMGAKVKMLN